MFYDQPHIFQMADARLGMAKPETFRVAPDQRSRALDQFRRSRSGRRNFAQMIVTGDHAHNLGSVQRKSKAP